MPRITKYDDAIFHKPNYWGKIFMYNNPSWNVLFPIVDIIRILPKETIITHTYAKNQGTIRLYGSQYNHSVIGIDLKKKEDYIENLKSVTFIFIFSDNQDTLADNLIKYCEKTKTNFICYSTLDSVYHVFENGTLITKIKSPSETIEKIKEIKERKTLNKLNELFPEFDVLQVENKETSCLEKCLVVLKSSQQDNNNKKVYTHKLPFDANFSKLKYLENSKKKIVYDDELPLRKTISELFKKK
jgi:hypothetical protein